MSFCSTDPNTHQSENTWFTPKWIIQALGGDFDLDPCTVSYRPFDTANYCVNYDLGECGLDLGWTGDVWLNPPYGKEITPFIDRFIEHKKGVCLIFARMGSKSIQDLLKAGAYLFCFRKRIKFIDKNGVSDTNAGTDSCLVFFDKKWLDRIKDNDNFNGVIVSQAILATAEKCVQAYNKNGV